MRRRRIAPAFTDIPPSLLKVALAVVSSATGVLLAALALCR